MKKISAILLCICLLGSLFITGCGENKNSTDETQKATKLNTNTTYVDDFYSKEAEVMGGEATLSIKADGTFKIKTTYSEGSQSVNGIYEEMSEKKLKLTPLNGVIENVNGEVEEKELKGEETIIAQLDGNVMTLGAGTDEYVQYIRVGTDG